MTPLIIPSPVILDHTFPRSDEQLVQVENALGRMQELAQTGELRVLLTTTLRDIVKDYNAWTANNIQQARDLWQLLALWFLQPHAFVEEVDPNIAGEVTPHPVPENCQEEGLVEVWADELARILRHHDANVGGNGYCVGVGCDNAFSGGQVGQYRPSDSPRRFPLVGPSNLDTLVDAYEWDIPAVAHQLNITVSEFRRNYKAIGALRIEKPDRDSHFKVVFPGQRPWVLDPNAGDPIPVAYLNELCTPTGMPLNAIKYALKYGVPVRKRCKLA